MENSIEQLQYPIGKFTCPKEITQNHISEWIATLETLPKLIVTIIVTHDLNGL